MLDVRDLSVSYGTIRAVRGISFTVGRGELVSLLGAIEPTQRPMNTQGEVGVMTFTFLSMTGLECLMVHGVPILEVMGSTSTDWERLKTLHIFD